MAFTFYQTAVLPKYDCKRKEKNLAVFKCNKRSVTVRLLHVKTGSFLVSLIRKKNKLVRVTLVVLQKKRRKTNKKIWHNNLAL